VYACGANSKQWVFACMHVKFHAASQVKVSINHNFNFRSVLFDDKNSLPYIQFVF
jgi:hypothetical protein